MSRGLTDVDSGFSSGAMVRLGRACLLVWLILTLGAPAPAVFRDGIGPPSDLGREDSAPEDSPPTEDETPQDPDFAPGVLPRDAEAPGRGQAYSPPLLSRLVASQSRAPRDRRPGLGHFLADGRALRLWLGSLTC